MIPYNKMPTELIDVQKELDEIEAEELKKQRHQDAMEMVNNIKDLYPDIAPTILYTAVIDYLCHPDKERPDFETDEDLKKEVDEMKRKADEVQGVIHGIEVLE